MPRPLHCFLLIAAVGFVLVGCNETGVTRADTATLTPISQAAIATATRLPPTATSTATLMPSPSISAPTSSATSGDTYRQTVVAGIPRPPRPVDDSETVWAELTARPLQLPTLTPGSACPKSSSQSVVDAGFGMALGNGPIYAAIQGGTLRVYSIDFSNGWTGQKTLWLASPTYTGPALIRGHQIDGPNELRFDNYSGNGWYTAAELRFATETGVRAVGSEQGWRFRPSGTSVHGPGCYAVQADGLNFSEIIVFEVIVL